MAEYHGQQYEAGKRAEKVPPMPEKPASATVVAAGTGSYARVRMIGHYGLGCAQSQTLDFRNVTLAQARQYRWDYYGLCGAQMTCYDSQGNVVHEE